MPGVPRTRDHDLVWPRYDPENYWENLVAARHMGMCNVLYTDGHVDSHRPEDLDPRVDDIQKELWCPTTDRWDLPSGTK